LELRYYTDGACSVNSGIGGRAYVKADVDEAGNIDVVEMKSFGEKNTTNNRQEIKAILDALEDLSVEVISVPTKVVILSDSQYCINSFNQWLANWAKKDYLRNTPGKTLKNDDLWELAENLRKDCLKNPNITLEFKWVKGHADNPYNTKADELAVAARVALAEEEE